MIEQFRLEGTSGSHLVQCTTQMKDSFKVKLNVEGKIAQVTQGVIWQSQVLKWRFLYPSVELLNYTLNPYFLSDF